MESDWIVIDRRKWDRIPPGSLVKYVNTEGEERMGGAFVEIYECDKGSFMKYRGKVGKKTFTINLENIQSLHKKKDFTDEHIFGLLQRITALEHRLDALTNRNSAMERRTSKSNI